MPRKPVLKPPFLSGGKELYFTIEPTHMPHRVLVIDDDPTFCRMLEGFLQRKGMDAKGVFSGEEALLTMEKKKPLILF